MMMHHCFNNSEMLSPYDISFVPFTESSVITFAYVSKICVSIYAFISGYGLYLAYDKKTINTTKWVLYRYIKTFSGYWFVWIISAIICQIINQRTTSIFLKDGAEMGILYTIIDFLGLHNLFTTPSISGTWWYMTAAAVFILITPILYHHKDNAWLALFCVIIFIRIVNRDDYFTGNNSVYAFLTPFIIGFIFARHNLFDKIISIGKNSKWTIAYKVLLELWFIIMVYRMYSKVPIYRFWEFHFGFFPVLIISFCVEFIIQNHIFKRVLVFLGKHSMNVFLVHTFIRGYYLSELTYSFKHFLVIYLFLFLSSICMSVAIEYAKKATRYNYLIGKILAFLQA